MARNSFIILVALGIVTGVVFGADPALDLQVAAFFHDVSAQPEFRRFDWIIDVMRRVGPFVIAAAVAPAAVTLAMKLFWPQRPALISSRAALFLALSLALGPGLLVNGILKESWSRPRPGMVTEFGGGHTFRPWWDPRGSCQTNCSFVSGETSSAVWMTAPALLAPAPWRYAALGVAGLYAAAFAFIRMLAGGHFMSDVIFAAVFTGLVIWAVHGFLFRWRATRIDDRALDGRLNKLGGALTRVFTGAWSGRAARPDQAVEASAPRIMAIMDNIRGSLGALAGRPKYVSPPAGDAGAASFEPAWRRLGWQAALTVAAVAPLMVFLDIPLHRLAAGLPGWMVRGAFVVSNAGLSGWILVPTGVALVLLTLLSSPALDYMSRAVLAMVATRFGFVFVAVGLPGLVVTIVKRWIGRVRPSPAGPFAYEPFSWRPEYASFPSGHATTAFAALVAIGVLFPRLRPALWCYALAVAASRVMVSAHWPSDVIAGAVVGAFGAVLVREWFAVRRLGFHVGRDGAVRTMAAPSLQRIKRAAAGLLSLKVRNGVTAGADRRRSRSS